MQHFRFLVLALALFPVFLQAQDYAFATYDTFEGFAEQHLENLHPDTTYVINFWATWCGPCVKELPFFEELHASAKTQAIKVTLVTIDLPMAYEKSLLPFLEKQNLQAEVVGLLDGDANAWIDKIDSSWSGAIPITLFFKNGEKRFFEKAYHSLEELTTDLP